MKKWMLAVPALLLALGCMPTEPAPDEKPEEKAPTVVKTYECRWAQGPIKVDGRGNEEAWEKAAVVKDFVVFWQKRKAKTTTTARLLWNERYLFFLAEMEDSDIYANVAERNGMTWHNDVFELFFKPAVDKDTTFPLQYYEFQVNAMNTQLELFLPSRGAGGYGRFAPLTKLGMESSVKLDGTLNNPRDKDKGWVVEGRIPWRAFKEAGEAPNPGAVWKFALCRYDYSVAFESPELSSTAGLTLPDFHRYEDYSELKFLGADD